MRPLKYLRYQANMLKYSTITGMNKFNPIHTQSYWFTTDQISHFTNHIFHITY